MFSIVGQLRTKLPAWCAAFALLPALIFPGLRPSVCSCSGELRLMSAAISGSCCRELTQASKLASEPACCMAKQSSHTDVDGRSPGCCGQTKCGVDFEGPQATAGRCEVLGDCCCNPTAPAANSEFVDSFSRPLQICFFALPDEEFGGKLPFARLPELPWEVSSADNLSANERCARICVWRN